MSISETEPSDDEGVEPARPGGVDGDNANLIARQARTASRWRAVVGIAALLIFTCVGMAVIVATNGEEKDGVSMDAAPTSNPFLERPTPSAGHARPSAYTPPPATGSYAPVPTKPLAPGTPSDATNADDSFLSTISVHPNFSSVPDAQLIEAGHAICDLLDTGADIAAVGAAAGGSGLTSDELVVLAVSAVGAYCPEYESQF
ncbi:DUF732 domain-containing protein [Modestobacter versicolor]|uniref:DUF732 domain-containing protein n=1 Tax=Modestobacter versicolor TaxID=429133 RepID=A0A839Y380_9ACTN|nr:DUF732 domain-containing protein [Modestobacter versicolor]MBB3675822.1 hypothetical protein [Modestobacter versicolor]